MLDRGCRRVSAKPRDRVEPSQRPSDRRERERIAHNASHGAGMEIKTFGDFVDACRFVEIEAANLIGPCAGKPGCSNSWAISWERAIS